MPNGFLAGVAEGLTSEFESRRKQKLALALQSQKIEAEVEAFKEKERFKKELGVGVSGGVGKGVFSEQLAEGLGVTPEEIEALPEKQAFGLLRLFKQKAIGKRQQLGFDIPVQSRRTIGGIQFTTIRDKRTGTVLRADPEGLDPVNDRKLRAAINPLNRDIQAIVKIRNLAEQTIKANTPLQQLAQAGKLKVNDLVQFNPKAARLFRMIPSIAAAVVRRFGDRGRLSDVDIERGKKVLPKIADRREVALGLLDTLIELSDLERQIIISDFATPTGQLIRRPFGEFGDPDKIADMLESQFGLAPKKKGKPPASSLVPNNISSKSTDELFQELIK